MSRTALYRHFDADGALLYVGISCRPITRLKQHEHDSSWAAQIARVSVERFLTRQEALEAERLAIKKERPRHNVIHARDARTCKAIELRFRRGRYTFESSTDLARFLRSCALDVQRGEMSNKECAYLLRWVQRGWPALWQRTTSRLIGYGILTSGCTKTLTECGGTLPMKTASDAKVEASSSSC